MKDGTITLKKSELLPLASLAILLVLYLVHDTSYVWIEMWFLIEILVITWWTRNLPLKAAIPLYSQGLVISFGGTVLLGSMFSVVNLYEVNSVRGALIMPVVEEVLKLAPMLFALWVVKTKNRIMEYSASDYLFMGVVAASAFSLVEKYMWDGITFPFTYGPHIGSLYFFPDALGVYASDGSEFGYIGHAAATGIAAMGIGIGMYLKKKGFGLWWALPLATFAWVTIEHILLNMYYANGSEALAAIGGGQLTPWLFIALLAGTLYIDFSQKKLLTNSPNQNDNGTA